MAWMTIVSTSDAARSFPLVRALEAGRDATKVARPTHSIKMILFIRGLTLSMRRGKYRPARASKCYHLRAAKARHFLMVLDGPMSAHRRMSSGFRHARHGDDHQGAGDGEVLEEHVAL